MDIKYFDKIINQLSQFEDDELILSSYWDIIYNNLYLTHELLKLKKFKLFTELNPDFFKEEVICSDLISYDNPPYHYINDKFLNSKSFWIRTIEKDYTYISKIPEKFLELNDDFCFWISEKFSDFPVLCYFPDSLKNNFDLAYFSVNMNPENFKSLNNDFKNNPYIYEIIFKNKKIKSSDYFKLAGKDIKSNYKFAKRSIIENPSTFLIVDNKLKNDSAFFLEILNYSENILKFASNDVKNNDLYVLASIEKNPLSLEFANNRFKSSVPFILSIYDYIKEFNNFSDFVKILDTKVFNNEQFVTQYFDLISQNSSYYLLGNDIKSNREIMKNFVYKDINAFNYVSEGLKNDISFIKNCYEYHNQKHLLHQFEMDSTQSSIFKMLDEKQLNDIFFIHQLYTTFKPIFKEIVFPIIKQRKTVLLEQLSNELSIEQGINHLLEKFDLKNKLENQLHHSIKLKSRKI